MIVDLFTSACRPATLRLLEMVTDLLFLLLAAVLVWRLTVAGLDAREYVEQSMILELPLWIVYIEGALTQMLLALCCINKVYLYFRGLGK